MSTLLAALDAAGLLDPTWKLPLGEGGGRDNLIHGAAVAIALEKPEDRQAWLLDVLNFLEHAQVPGRRGLYYREQNNHSSNSYDNLIGTSVVSSLLDLSHAERVYDWGRSHDWCYNVEFPSEFELRHWYGRFIGAPGFIKMAAGRQVYLSQWNMAAAIEASLEPHNPDKADVGNKLLMWLWKQALQGRSRYLDIWWRWWEREMAAKYPGGLEEFLGYYFKPLSTHWQVTLATGQITEATREHPFVVASRGRNF